MTQPLRTISRVAVLVILMLSALPGSIAYAAVQCTASITPTSATPTTAPTFDITINNTGDTDIQWIDLSILSSNLQYNGSYISGWSPAEHGDGITLNGNTLAAGTSATFTLQAIVGLRISNGNHWQAQVSDDSGGANPVICSGTLDTAIVGHPPNSTDNGVSAVSVSDVTTNSATISWNSDNATTSYIYYGTSNNYGSTSGYDASLDNAHMVTLTGLSPGTPYHFQVAGDDGSWGFAYSGDNTFTTAAAASSATNSPTGTPSANVPGASIKANPTETIPPTISLTTDFSHPFNAAPTITGIASDNDGVAAIEFSTDGGINWQPVTTITRLGRQGSRNVSFTFTPVLTDDGNYSIEARATDTSANTATTNPVTIVIDRLPPQTGPLVLAYGPQLLQPDSTGIVNLVAGSEYHVTTSAIGGVISLALDAQPLTNGAGGPMSSTSALTQSPGTGLWSGTMSFKTGGTYQLIARSVDGAGNRSTRPVMTVQVLAPGTITESGTAHLLAGAHIIVHYREPISGHWQIWDGKPYHQTNPQTTNAKGTYSLVVPRGTYYLEVKAHLHYSFISNIFTTTQPQPIAAAIALGNIPHLALGPITLALPNLVFQAHDLPAPAQIATTTPTSQLLGANLPDFTLPATDGTTQTALGLAGKPTLITILSTWSPDAQAQIPQLAAAQSNPDINVVPIFSEEHLPLVTSYLASAGYHLTALADPDGVITKPLGVGPLPEHIFIDSTGKIKTILTGVYTKDELLLQLGGL